MKRQTTGLNERSTQENLKLSITTLFKSRIESYKKNYWTVVRSDFWSSIKVNKFMRKIQIQFSTVEQLHLTINFGRAFFNIINVLVFSIMLHTSLVNVEKKTNVLSSTDRNIDKNTS